MAKRRPMTKKKSRKTFKKGLKVKAKNLTRSSQMRRGGMRL